MVRRLASGSVPSTAITLLVLSHFDLNGAAMRDLITTVLSVALFVTAGLLIYRRRLLTFFAARVGELSARQTNRLTFLSGAVLGVLVSISSVGAGAIGVTFLILLYPHLPMARIVGSDIAHAVPLTLVAGLGHWMLGSVDWHIFGSLLVGSLPGIFLGSYLSGRVAELALRIILALTLTVVGSKLAFEQIQNRLATVVSVAKSVRSLKESTYRQFQSPRCSPRLIPIGLPGRPAAWTTRSPSQRPAFFMKKPPMCHKPGLGCTASGEIDLPAFLGVSSLDLASLRRGIFLGQMARDRAVSVLHAANVCEQLVRWRMSTSAG